MTSLPFLRGLWLVLCLAFTGIYLAGQMGYRLNTTRSAPLGVWRIISDDPTQLRVGDYALLCPPTNKTIRMLVEHGVLTRGDCRNGESPFVKRVVALEGVNFSVTSDGVALDGLVIASSEPVDIVGLSRSAPAVVPNGHFIGLQTMHPRSIDSRYFGPIPISDVLGIMEPTWTAGAGS